MSFNCPTCASEVPTRVLADAVTLVVIGHCDDHGVSELTRVYVGELPAYPDDPTVTERVAYRPGECCGRRMGESAACRLPIGHDEEHAA